MKLFTLIGPDGQSYASLEKGALGGNCRSKVYGLFDCKAAARGLARGTYRRNRVFFADEPTALAAGYKPCGVYLPARAFLVRASPRGLRRD